MNLLIDIRKIFFSFYLGIIHLYSPAQQLYPVVSDIDTIYFRLAREDNKWAIQSMVLPPKDRFPEIASLELIDADLHLKFRFGRKLHQYDPGVITMKCLRDSKGNVIIPLNYKLSNVQIRPNHLEGQRIWQDALEDVLRAEHEYKLVIERALMESIDCSKSEPSFDFHQQWPHFTVAAASIGAIGVGWIYLNQRNELYDSYQLAWINGLTSELADPNFEEAKKYNKQAAAWINTSLAVLTADILLYSYRLIAFNKKKKLYKEFCSPQPVLGFQLIRNPADPKIGMIDVTLKF